MSREKEWVREHYAALAGGSAECCCGGSAAGSEPAAKAAEKIGYSPEQLAAVPEGANLGLGCGNPVGLASIADGETVLDLGCGAGFDALLAAARVGPTGRVIGVDMTPEMIEKARRNAERSGHANVEFRPGDIEALPVEDASIDLVISNCVLNLVPDKAKAFREIVRVLKPGGRIAISDIVLDAPLPTQLCDNAAAYCSCVSGAIARADYLHTLEAAGLIEVRVVSEAGAAELLAGSCCGVSVDDLVGVVTSVTVTGRKPRPCCR